MTIDPFTEAARAEAERLWPGVGRGQSRADLDRAMRGGFQVGAEWAREQEPTDAEVRAVWYALGSRVTIAMEYEDLRSALSAARTARRDKEKRND